MASPRLGRADDRPRASETTPLMPIPTRSSAAYVDMEEAEVHTSHRFDEEEREEGNPREPADGEDIRPGESLLERRKRELNYLFGFKPWKSHITHVPLERRSTIVKALYEPPRKVKPVESDSLISCGNLCWVIFFGWWLALFYVIAAVMLAITVVGLPYARFCWQMKNYVFWPFGKYLVRQYSDSEVEELCKGRPERSPGGAAGFVVYAVVVSLVLPVAHMVAFALCWLLVVLIPMAKINNELVRLLYQSPLTIRISTDFPHGREVLLCTYQAANRYYYKYSVGGMNVVLVNMLPFVLLSLVLGYIPKQFVPNRDIILFFTALLSTIPLSYYIGMALSSISAQTSVAVGAVLNASFGSAIELTLYGAAVKNGGLNDLVQASVIGTLLGMMLLLPGLSMMAGGFKHKNQRFNPTAAGVSSVLLIISIIGAFAPTVFYQIYGSRVLECSGCTPMAVNSTQTACGHCQWRPMALDDDPVYREKARPLMYACAIILPIAYLVGLVFTLKTHRHIVQPPEEEAGEGHDAPEWGKLRSVVVLIVSTVLFALIADELVVALEPALKKLNVSQVFVGMTLIALVPSTAEFVNAIGFALQNNVSLSIEIAGSASVQTCLIQMPALVLLTAILGSSSSGSFTLIFDGMEVFGVVFGVIILNYLSIEGRSNYFTGAALCIIWSLLICTFWFVPSAS